MDFSNFNPKMLLASIQYQLRKFFKNCWPINWVYFKDWQVMSKAILNTSYFVKISLTTCLIGVIISLFFVSFNSFQVFTTRVAASGGVFREALFGSKISNFNPLTNYNSDEQKIISLIYHPLFWVSYPDFLSDQASEPEITPVLLKSEPSWSAKPGDDTKPFYSLDFELKENLLWTDGSKITNQDVSYTFQQLQSEGANDNFRTLFADYDLILETGSETKFSIKPKNDEVIVNPQLKFLSNFFPVSKDYFSKEGFNSNNRQFQNYSQAVKAPVTSGYFYIPEKVEDPDSSDEKNLQNPVWDNNIGGYNKVVLQKNLHQNYGKEVFIEQYIFDIYDSLADQGGAENNSIQRAVNAGKVDLYSRFMSPGADSSASVKNILKLNQKVQPTNIYFNLYLNAQSTRGGTVGYLINQNLRKYIVCGFKDFSLPGSYGKYNQVLPPEKRFLPLQFGEDFDLDCENAREELLNYQNNGVTVYSIEENERNDFRRISVFGDTFGEESRLVYLALNEFQEYSKVVETRMQSLGLPVEAVYVDSSELNQRLQDKNYHLTFLPITQLNRDPYPSFGLNTKNLSNITLNERIGGEVAETNLAKYSQSNLTDQEAKNQLIEFFKTSFLSVNLFRTTREFNYSNKLQDSSEVIQNIYGFSIEIYQSLPDWYIETRRKFTLFGS